MHCLSHRPRRAEFLEGEIQWHSPGLGHDVEQIHPNNIGHKDWPGCFRCHDNEHATADKKRKINSQDCNSCHIILAEGRGAELEQLHPQGKKFSHPEAGWEDLKCYDCHTGTVESKK